MNLGPCKGKFLEAMERYGDGGSPDLEPGTKDMEIEMDDLGGPQSKVSGTTSAQSENAASPPLGVAGRGSGRP